jgi:hypothetical protein
MEKSPLHKIIDHFQQSFQSLSISVSAEQIEHLALLVYNAMEGEKRKFHTPEHALEVCDNLHNPYQILAALFHDVVYYQIDGGLPKHIRNLLSNYIFIREGDVYIQNQESLHSDKIFSLTRDLFNFKEGQKLVPFSGLNEFLSALVAVKELESIAPIKCLVSIIVCIEATIPFRMPNREGKTHFEQIEAKVIEVNQAYGLGLSAEEIEQMVKLAVVVANQDVINFSYEDTGKFLDNTWLLLFEANDLFNNSEGHTYSISKYRQALTKTEGFIGNLNFNSIFHEYHQIPAPEEYAKMRLQAQQNIKYAREYLALKLLTATILEALAMATGGDAPMVLFTGGIRSSQNMLERIEDYLPALSENVGTEYDHIVLNLLEYGRATETDLDMKNAPVAAFVYKSLGSEASKELLAKAREFYQDKMDYHTFLALVEPKVLSAIAKATASIAVTRQEALKKYILENTYSAV